MADRPNPESFQEIQRQYLQMNQLKRFIWKEIEQTSLDPETQREILNRTYFFTSNSKFPPSVSYQRLFLKQFLKLCEDKGSEICDEMYEAYGAVFSKVEQLDDKCYKMYTLPCGALITLEETQQYISEGTTGLHTWMAGEYLAEWALESRSIFQERNIIELGSGTGLTGLTICATSTSYQYIFTDCHEKVLETLECNLILNNFVKSCRPTGMSEITGRIKSTLSGQEDCLSKCSPSDGNCENTRKDQRHLHGMREERHYLEPYGCSWSCLACRALDTEDTTTTGGGRIAYYRRKSLLNFQHLNEECGRHSGNVQVSVRHLDWINWKMDHFAKLPLGIILAADVIYDVELIPYLVRTIHVLLSTSGDGVGRPVAYIASTIRNLTTYEFFINQLNLGQLENPVMDLLF
ncbi:protein-lysine N-methyltransferase EEF2KMT-like isoform X2 [Montipora foliosa]|uniref:protein-lysine N-methyltransferase EEF2KMT-like isoform X2 n=1 Tax=Montipora foliosa TaxID=591990 RepID=UPI0035F1A3E3